MAISQRGAVVLFDPYLPIHNIVNRMVSIKMQYKKSYILILHSFNSYIRLIAIHHTQLRWL